MYVPKKEKIASVPEISNSYFVLGIRDTVVSKTKFPPSWNLQALNK